MDVLDTPTPSTPSKATVEKVVLTAHDRCDSCGAQAFIRATLKNGQLLFCAHHGRKYETKLSVMALTIEDGTDTINKAASPAAY